MSVYTTAAAFFVATIGLQNYLVMLMLNAFQLILQKKKNFKGEKKEKSDYNI